MLYTSLQGTPVFDQWEFHGMWLPVFFFSWLKGCISWLNGVLEKPGLERIQSSRIVNPPHWTTQNNLIPLSTSFLKEHLPKIWVFKKGILVGKSGQKRFKILIAHCVYCVWGKRLAFPLCRKSYEGALCIHNLNCFSPPNPQISVHATVTQDFDGSEIPSNQLRFIESLQDWGDCQREMLGTLGRVPWAVVPQIVPHIALYNHYIIHI